MREMRCDNGSMTLAQVLQAHVATDDKEAADRARMLTFAASLGKPFSRRQWPAHFTGSAVVVHPSGEQVVLLLHAKLQRWLQPGGHADPVDEGDLAQTALREAREETGLDVALVRPEPVDLDVHTIPARKDEPTHEHLDVRYVVVARPPAELHPDEAESTGAQWLTWAEALARADEAPLRRLLAKAQTWVAAPAPGRATGDTK